MRFLWLILLALSLLRPAHAQDFDALAAQLGGGFAQQAEAAERLGALGDPRAIPLLRALADAQLRRDGATVRAGGEGEVIRINNRVRGAIRVALGRLQLVSPDPAERLAAADNILRARSADDIRLLEDALSRETIPRVRERMDGSMEISSDNPTVKTVDVLDGSTQVTVHGRVVWRWNGRKM